MGLVEEERDRGLQEQNPMLGKTFTCNNTLESIPRLHIPQVKQYQDFGISFNEKEYRVPSPECEVAGPGCKIRSQENIFLSIFLIN